jgi:SHS2 domain-containing protein
VKIGQRCDLTELVSSSTPIFDKYSEDSISAEYNQMKRSTNQKEESESLASVKTKDTIQPERSAKREKGHRRVQDLVDTTSDSFSVPSETSQRAKRDIDYICGCIPDDFQDIFTLYDTESHSEHDSETIEVTVHKEVPEELISDLLENLLDSMDGDKVTTKDLKLTAKKLNMTPGDLFEIIKADIFTLHDTESHSEHDSETIKVTVHKEVPEELISDCLENLLYSMDGDKVTTKDLKLTAKKLNMTPGDLFEIIEAAKKQAQ